MRVILKVDPSAPSQAALADLHGVWINYPCQILPKMESNEKKKRLFKVTTFFFLKSALVKYKVCKIKSSNVQYIIQ